MGLTIEAPQHGGDRRRTTVSTFTAKERLYRTPAGDIVGEDGVVDGSTLAAAAGDEFPMDEAKRLGLTGDKPAGPPAIVGEKTQTALADAQRAKAAQAQLEQHEQLAASSSATDAEQQAALADERARAEEAAATAEQSAERAEKEQRKPRDKAVTKPASK